MNLKKHNGCKKEPGGGTMGKTDIRRKASQKAGGIGNRYTCLATLGDRQREIQLYKDEDRWFLDENF